MKNKQTKRLSKKKIGRFRGLWTGYIKDQRGEGFIDVLVKMLIVVVVGAVLLTIMRAAIPSMFEDMMTKIRNVFEL